MRVMEAHGDLERQVKKRERDTGRKIRKTEKPIEKTEIQRERAGQGTVIPCYFKHTKIVTFPSSSSLFFLLPSLLLIIRRV